jgi:hypothetical protein
VEEGSMESRSKHFFYIAMIDAFRRGCGKVFLGNFSSKIRSQVIECSFSADAEIDRNYCFGSFFNSHSRFH